MCGDGGVLKTLKNSVQRFHVEARGLKNDFKNACGKFSATPLSKFAGIFYEYQRVNLEQSKYAHSFLASNPSVKSPLHTQNQLTHQNFVEYLFSNRFCRRFPTDSHVIQTQFKYLMVATTLLTAANHANLPIICRLLCRRCVSRSSSSILLNGSAHSLDSQFLALCERIHR